MSNINIKEQVSKIKGGGGAMPAGVNDNVEVEKVERGSNYVDIHLKDAYGRIKKDRVFDPDKNYVYPREGQSKEEAFTDSVNDRSKLLLQYVIAVSDNVLPDNVSSYTDIVNLTLSALAAPKHKVNLKLVPHKTEATWSDFPRYAPYIDRYDTELPTSLYFSKYELDLFKKETPKSTKSGDSTFTLF